MKSATAFIMIGMLALCTLGQTGQKSPASLIDDVLERRVSASKLEYLTSTEVVSSALKFVNVPGGIIRISSCKEENLTRPWKPKDSPLRQVLDLVISADPRYRWEIQEGVVNLLLATGEPPLLGTLINEFHVEKVTSAKDALGLLLALPEVRKAMADLKLEEGLTLIVSPFSLRPKEFTVSCKNVTLRQALNAIARAQGRAVWDYIEIPCNGKNEVVIRF